MKRVQLLLLVGVILFFPARLARAATPEVTLPALTDSPTTVTSATDWASQVAAGYAHTCVLTPAGGVLCWGGGRAAPVAIPGLASGVKAITAGGRHSCALLVNGKVQCWGDNNDGQLGNGALYLGGGDTPVDVVGLGDGVQAVSAGYEHTCALTAAGGVKCWGANGRGQIGNGVFGYYELTPVDVVGLINGVRAISAGYNHTCALTERGGIQCWGSNSGGQLGDGAGGGWAQSETPVAVVGLTNGVRAIEAGNSHTCALIENRGVLCWGWNGYGELGDGTKTMRLTPVAVIGLTGDVQAISAGGLHTCALTESGAGQCWGLNYLGQLGDGTTTDRLTPIAPLALPSGLPALSAGDNHTCAVTATGGVKCWGSNASGQLGDWTTTTRLAPVDVRPLTFDCPAVTEIPAAECTALVALFANTWGLGWTDRTGWLEAATPCDWRGVTCAAGHVRGLDLAGHHLVGALPAEIGQLNGLQTLDLSNNHLTWLPPELGNLGELQVLDLSDNAFYATTIPPELGNLGNLRQLNLCHAAFYFVTLPPALGQLRQLQVLDLSQNILTGTLPAAWSGLTAVQELILNEANLSGPLPSTLGQLSALRTLNLNYNQFSGTFPPELGHLLALQVFQARGNQFSGPLPPELGQLSALQTLDLRDNQLSGALPAELGQWRAIQHLDLAGNHCSGPLPPELGQWRRVQSVDLRYNQFSGPLPPELGRLSTLQTLDLRNNQLSGPIPPELGQLSAMQSLDLSYNQLSGPLPPELSQLAAIKNLYLQNNHFSGLIPPELGQLAALQGYATAAAGPDATANAPTGVLYPHPPPIPPAGGISICPAINSAGLFRPHWVS